MIKTTLYNKVINYNFENLFKKKGYAYFTNGAYNLNIIGIRASEDKVTNKFDDILILIYKTPNGNWAKQIYKITTDPGKYYMNKPSNPKGTAILVPGQYRGAYKIGFHRGKYKALCQHKLVKVYRDNNKNEIYDYNPDTIDEGFFGINIHKAGKDSKQVDTWSAGCQVFAVEREFKSFMEFCQKQIDYTKCETFTYTLLREEDLV
ncbi:hypothetical protein [Clostridium sp.]|uniref:hypothetical protein n=1 Tax=Clostridium sp. TaxID=1506 RepID=UPI0025C46FCB|nr:hypothetical protein [Clostridium sp.]